MTFTIKVAPHAGAWIETRYKNMSDEQFEGYARVSAIMSPFTGYQNIDPTILQKAADRGTRTHQSIHALLKGLGLWEEDETIKGFIESFEKFWNKSYGNIVQLENRYYCHQLKITGQVDLIAEIPNHGQCLIDWKTSSKVNKTWLGQGSAYAYLARQNGFKIESIAFVKLDRTGKFPELHFIEEDFGLFLKCYEVYNHFFKDQKQPKLAFSLD